VRKEYSIKELMKDSSQLFFGLIGGLTLCGMVPWVWECATNFSRVKAEKPETYLWPEISDFKLTVVAGFIFAGLEIGSMPIICKLFTPFCKEQKDMKVREFRSMKASNCAFKASYFTIVTFFGY
jgi:hypothetical protein